MRGSCKSPAPESNRNSPSLPPISPNGIPPSSPGLAEGNEAYPGIPHPQTPEPQRGSAYPNGTPPSSPGSADGNEAYPGIPHPKKHDAKALHQNIHQTPHLSTRPLPDHTFPPPPSSLRKGSSTGARPISKLHPLNRDRMRGPSCISPSQQEQGFGSTSECYDLTAPEPDALRHARAAHAIP